MNDDDAGSGARLDPIVASEVLACAHDPIVIMDLTATITWANDATRSLGWEPAALIGRTGFELVPPDEVDRALVALAAINGGNPPPSSAPYNILTPDGGTVECDLSPWVIGDPDAPRGIAIHIRPTQDSRILRRLLERLLSGDNGPAVLDALLEVLYHRNDSARAIVTFIDEDGATRQVGHELDPLLGGLGIDDPHSPWSRAVASGTHVLVEDLDALPEGVRALALAEDFRELWIVPVTNEGEHLATITLWGLEAGPPVQVDTYSVTLLEQLIALVLRWRRQARDLERAATRDPLTGLPNRRALAEFDADGPRRDVGVLYIDLDRFKPVNDRLGHAAGDQVLRTVANRLQSAVRPTDIVARLGGDEFGIVCPGCSHEELDALAVRVHRLLGEAIGVHGDVVTIGSSIGAALGHDSVGPLLETADRALYDAKESGRGTIRWADAGAHPPP